MELKTKISLSNLGTVNKNRVVIGNLELWFSYETIIAFDDIDGLKVSENIWSKTTGKLLNELCPDHKERIPNEEFNRQLQEVLNKHKLSG